MRKRSHAPRCLGWRMVAILALAAMLCAPALISADAASVTIAGKRAVLEKPANPTASLILVPGEGGLADNDPLQRATSAYVDSGIAVLSVDSNANLGAAVKYMSNVAKPVSVAAVSAGVIRTAAALGLGRLPTQHLILVSGNLQAAQQKIGSPSKLPTTLVIHHRKDACSQTKPSAVEQFVEWTKGKARVLWLSGGQNAGDSCSPRSYHGLAGLDDDVVKAISEFVH